MLTVNALFAGFSAAMLVNLVLRPAEDNVPFYLAIFLAIAALYCFAFAAELITDALDEGQRAKYVNSMKVYNLGVICILWSLGAFLWIHGPNSFWIIAIVASIYPWLKDLWWLLFAKKADKDAYYARLDTVDGG